MKVDVPSSLHQVQIYSLFLLQAVIATIKKMRNLSEVELNWRRKLCWGVKGANSANGLNWRNCTHAMVETSAVRINRH
jgi:hypothetical protein